MQRDPLHKEASRQPSGAKRINARSNCLWRRGGGDFRNSRFAACNFESRNNTIVRCKPQLFRYSLLSSPILNLFLYLGVQTIRNTILLAMTHFKHPNHEIETHRPPGRSRGRRRTPRPAAGASSDRRPTRAGGGTRIPSKFRPGLPHFGRGRSRPAVKEQAGIRGENSWANPTESSLDEKVPRPQWSTINRFCRFQLRSFLAYPFCRSRFRLSEPGS